MDVKGFEPSTFGMQNQRSPVDATRPRNNISQQIIFKRYNGPDEIWTHDLLYAKQAFSHWTTSPEQKTIKNKI